MIFACPEERCSEVNFTKDMESAMVSLLLSVFSPLVAAILSHRIANASLRW